MINRLLYNMSDTCQKYPKKKSDSSKATDAAFYFAFAGLLDFCPLLWKVYCEISYYFRNSESSEQQERMKEVSSRRKYINIETLNWFNSFQIDTVPFKLLSKTSYLTEAQKWSSAPCRNIRPFWQMLIITYFSRVNVSSLDKLVINQVNTCLFYQACKVHDIVCFGD